MSTKDGEPRLWGKWQPEESSSGPIVSLVDVKNKPHLTVYPDISINEERYERDRRLMCEEIATFLNGGPKPPWVCDMDSFGDGGMFSVSGGCIIASGPLVYNSNSGVNWEWDDSEVAESNRKKLIGIFNQ